MCAATGLRNLQRRRNPIGACGFQVGEGVQHRRVFVEIRGHPPARVVIAERVEPDVEIAAQVFGDHLRSKCQIGCVGSAHSLAPIAVDGRHPTRSPVTSVLPAERVYIGAATKEACVEPEFLLGGRPHIHWRGRRTCEGWLIWIRGAGLLLTELEQPTQAYVIGTERRQLTGKLLLHDLHFASRESLAQSLASVAPMSLVSR